MATGAASPYWWSHPHTAHAPEGTTGDPKGALEKGDKSDKRALTEKVGKLGENMQIRRFTRYQLGA